MGPFANIHPRSPSLAFRTAMLARLWSTVLVAASSTTAALASLLGKPFNGSYDTTPELSAELLTKRAVSSPYVFTAFTSKSESNLYVYTSNDGTNFSLLKGSAYTPPSGLIRDPSVILHTEYVSVCLRGGGLTFLKFQWKILHLM